jgi:pimeloyl-ACP methyl ester carboxylesterase
VSDRVPDVDRPRSRPSVGGAAEGPRGIRVSEREVRVSGHPIRYEVAGEGSEPVVLVHGLSGSTRWWSPNVPALAEHHRVYLVNLPGFGVMRRRRQRFVLTEAASWLLAWIEALGLEKAHLVGHSMGGYLSLKLATRRPDVVRKLVLVDPAGVPSGRTMLGHLGPLLLAARYGKPNFLPVLARDALYAGPFTLLRTARDLLAEDVRGDLRKIGMPTLLVWGERDTLIPPSVGDLMRAEIPGSRLLVIEGAGHNPMFDRPEAFNVALLAFLAGESVGE